MKSTAKTVVKPTQSMLAHRLQEGLLILCCAFAVFLLIALATYHRADLMAISPEQVAHVANAGGRVGAWFALILFKLFGYIAYLFPPMLIYWSWQGLRGHFDIAHPDYYFFALRLAGFILVLLAGGGLIGMHDVGGSHAVLTFTAGGIIGAAVAKALVALFSFAGAALLLIALLLCGITLSTGLSWLRLLDKTGETALAFFDAIRERYWAWRDNRAEKRGEYEEDADEDDDEDAEDYEEKKPASAKLKKIGQRQLPRIEPEIFRQEAPKPVIKEKARTSAQLSTRSAKNGGPLPSLKLLDPPEKPTGKGYTNEELEHLSREVELRLQDFGIEVQVVAVHPGPVVTRFEMQLAAGVKVSRITTLAKDLARSLSAISVRIVEVIPGKSVVGLELPNKNRDVVRLSEVLASHQYEQARSPLSLALGKDIAGHPVIVDLAKMPHLLVAGTTGSGKSVGMNAMLLSMLFKATPEQVRLIMIDPKMLELSIYEGIPHLLAPVVTDMKEAANALRWCVAEMERRYKIMAALGVRNLVGYNQKIAEANEKEEPILDPFWREEHGGEAEPLQHLPYIVVLIDEFADMMMVVGKKVEELIARIAQKARAAGIHLLLATQRPSVDVITGLIKANIPTRIAFQVSSKIDSRTILDQQGAEQLLGYGDMLYLAPGTGVPVRVHGAYVADHEVHVVVNDLKQRGAPDYITEITESDDEADGEAGGAQEDDAEKDPLYDEAVQLVIDTRRASISSLQRRFKIGYNRAARLVEDMERAGIVSPMESNGSREVLVSSMAD